MNNGTINAKDVAPSYNVLTFCEYFVTLILYSISLLLLLRILWGVRRKGKTASKKASLSRANVTPSLLLYFIAWTVDIIVSIPFLVYYIVTWRANTPLRDGATWVWLAVWTFPLQAFVAVSVSTLTLERISCILWPGHRSPRQRWILTFFGITIGAIVACGSFAYLLIYELPIPPIIDCAGYAGCFRSPSTNFYNFSRQIISVINAILGICFFVLLQRRWKSSVASKSGNHFFGIAIAAHTGPIFPTVLPAMDVFVASIIYTAWLGKRLFRK
ncbi:hypothetical protein Ddc_19815 [Ditylenchus destructor]|nr:hypothetical protein Ddc_19815 [Ditylenchus destructor]